MLRDFGTFPVAVDVYPQGYEGPAREAAAFRYRSGWLMASAARMTMPFCTWRRTLLACVSDHGEIYPPNVAARLLAMPMSLPKDAEDDPPEVLEELTDALYWDFLGAMDEENLLYLYEAEEQSEKKLQDFEQRSLLVERKLASHLRQFRQERRREETSLERRAQIDATLARLEMVESQFAAAMRNHLSTIRAENDGLREVIYSALGDHGELEHLYTIRWSARQNRRAKSVRLPVFQEEPFSAEAWRNRNETGISTINVDQELTAIRFGSAPG
jgi:hypothetical protein